MGRIVSHDAGAQLLLAEAEVRLEAARSEGVTYLNDRLALLRPCSRGLDLLGIGLARLTRRLLSRSSDAGRICVE